MFWNSPQIDTSRLAELCRRVGMSLRAGVDARRVWAGEAERADGEEATRLTAVSNAVANGGSVADALAGRTITAHDDTASESLDGRAARAFRPADAPYDGDGYFPPLVCELVEVGEKSGHVDAALLQLADHYEHLAAMRSTFILGMIWPAVQLVIALAIVGLLIYVAGILSSTQDFTGKPLDFIGIGLTGPRGLVVYLGILAILFALGYIAYTSVASGWSGSDWLLNLAMKSPALGGCLQSMALARFCWSLAIAHEAGMDARRTAAAALRSTENRWYTRHAAAIDNSLREGNEFHQALTPTGAFPAELLHTLETAEQSGQITETMFRMAAKHQEEGRLAAQTLTLMAGWACWVLVAGVIVLLIFRLALWYVGQINGLLDQIK